MKKGEKPTTQWNVKNVNKKTSPQQQADTIQVKRNGGERTLLCKKRSFLKTFLSPSRFARMSWPVSVILCN